MPVNEKKMKALEKEYGKLKGKSIYYALEMKKKKKLKTNSQAMKKYK